MRDNGLSAAKAPADFKFAAAVASFGMLLRESPYAGDATFGSALELAEEGLGKDRYGYRGEFLELAAMAEQVAESRRR